MTDNRINARDQKPLIRVDINSFIILRLNVLVVGSVKKVNFCQSA